MCFYIICFFFILSSRFCVTNLLQIYFFVAVFEYSSLICISYCCHCSLWLFYIYGSCELCLFHFKLTHTTALQIFFHCFVVVVAVAFILFSFFFGFTFTPHKFALSNFPTSSLSQNINVCMWSGVVFVRICGYGRIFSSLIIWFLFLFLFCSIFAQYID